MLQFDFRLKIGMAMIPQETLRNSDLFLDAITQRVSRYPEGFRQCSLETLTHGTQAVFCLIRGGVSKKERDAELNYARMRLQRRVFSIDGLRSLLASFYATGKITTNSGDIAFAKSIPDQRFHNSGSSYHPWPGHLYVLGHTGQQTPGMNEPLVGKGLPPFSNPQDAVSSWIGIPIGDSDNRFSQLLLFLPDFTARLAALTFAEGLLRVRVRFMSEDLSISVLARDERTIFRKTKKLRKTQSFKMMEDPAALEVFVTDGDGAIVDSFSEREQWTTGKRVIFAGTRYSADTMQMVRRGETDVVEFKPFVRLDDMKKANELVKAVISFANTRGGTIFIGVTDDAEIVGIEPHIPHDERKASKFEKEYFSRLRELLKQKLNRVPQIDMRTERLGDKSVLIIQIAEGTNKPYYNIHTREIFVRRGGSDMRPDPELEMPQMLDNQVPGLGKFF